MATRWYFPSTGDAAISPAVDAAWEVEGGGTGTAFARNKLVTTKIASAMTTLTINDSNTDDQDIVMRQYVSDPIAAQTIAAQAIELQMRVSETSASNNMFLTLGIRVVSNDGTSVRGTILAVTRDNTEAATSLTNRRLTATSTEVIAQGGDRLVVEIGMGGNPLLATDQHDSSLRIGDADAADLPEDDTDTTDKNPWLEFPNNISFPATVRRYSLTLSGVG